MLRKMHLKLLVCIFIIRYIIANEENLFKNNSKSIEQFSVRYWPERHPCNGESSVSGKYCFGVLKINERSTSYNQRSTFFCQKRKRCDSKSCSLLNTNVTNGSDFYNTTLTRDVSSITNLEVANFSLNYIKIQWNMFGKQFYKLIFNLTPCTQYEISVVSCGGNFGDTRTIRQTTTYQKPSKIKELNVREIFTSSTPSFIISWTTPEIGLTCILYYAITVSTGDQVVYNDYIKVPKSMIMVTDLSACTVYKVALTTIDLDLQHGNILVNQTLPTSHKVRVREPRTAKGSTFDITNSSIKLFWNVTDEKNNCSDSFKILNCNCYAIRTEDYGYPLRNSFQNFTIEYHRGIVVTMNTNLSPFTTYACRARILNDFGYGPWSLNVTLKTKTGYPSSPQHFEVKSLNQTGVRFSWEHPKYIPTILSYYHLSIVGYVTYKRPKSCENTGVVNEAKILNGQLKSFDYICPLAFADYLAILKPENNTEWSAVATVQFRNLRIEVPGKVTNFTYTIKPSKDDPNRLDTDLSWQLPCIQNGFLDYFYVYVHGSRNNFPIHKIEEKIKLDGILDEFLFIYSLGELKPQYQYIFKVFAVTRGISEPGEAMEDIVIYPAGIPALPNDSYVQAITFNPIKTKRTSTTAMVLLPLFPDTNGEILYYAILVTEVGFGVSASSRYNLSVNTWPDIPRWKEAKANDFKITYQATIENWDPFLHRSDYILDYGHLKAIKFMLGDQPECEDLSKNNNLRVYCNGPLKPNTRYEVRIRAFTNGGYADSSPVFVMTKAEVQIAMVVGVISAILSLGLLVTVSLILFKKKSFMSFLKDFVNKEYSLPKEATKTVSSSPGINKY